MFIFQNTARPDRDISTPGSDKPVSCIPAACTGFPVPVRSGQCATGSGSTFPQLISRFWCGWSDNLLAALIVSDRPYRAGRYCRKSGSVPPLRSAFSHAGSEIRQDKESSVPHSRRSLAFPFIQRQALALANAQITNIFSWRTAISVSCLHFRQYSGKFSRTVSSRIFNRILQPQTGHKIHKV